MIVMGKMVRICCTVFCLLFFLVLYGNGLLGAPRSLEEADEAGEAKAREVIQAAISALGGKHFLGLENSYSQGRLFRFDKRGRKALVRYLDWTVYSPMKSRHQVGKGKRREVDIHNLELRKAWRLEGEDTVEEIPEEEIKRWERSVKRDINVLLKTRLSEPGLYLYYYGPEDISGSGNYEAVEFLDAENDSVVVYFDLESHLPGRAETEIRDRLGILHKQETEFLNWHTIQGVHTPLRFDYYSDGRQIQQVFVEEISHNVQIPPGHFLEPEVENKK